MTRFLEWAVIALAAIALVLLAFSCGSDDAEGVIIEGQGDRDAAEKAAQKSLATYAACPALAEKLPIVNSLATGGFKIVFDNFDAPFIQESTPSYTAMSIICGKARGRTITINTDATTLRHCPIEATIHHELLHLIGHTHFTAEDSPEFYRVLRECAL